MTLHIFNPEHDLALAADMPTFTPPHAARQLRHDLGFIPALWASDGDVVLVDNKGWAEKELPKVKAMLRRIGVDITNNVSFIEESEIHNLNIDDIRPWGWDTAIATRLIKNGIDYHLIPSAEQLSDIRWHSHRLTATKLLPQLLNIPNTIGQSFLCQSLSEIEEHLVKFDNIVIKAPWSSSGRGLRFGIGSLTEHQRGWIKNMISKQGALIVEPYYNKVKDIGMEFIRNNDGTLSYLGLSLFTTHNGAYTGNIIATENAKMDIIERHIDRETIYQLRDSICQLLPKLIPSYYGPIGIDMMLLHDGTIHPCVEINLRRTMGHVALNISPLQPDDLIKTMRIEQINSNYKLKIRQV